MMSRLFPAVAGAAALFAVGCGGASGNAPQPKSVEGNAIAITQHGVRALPYAPAGTTFDARLDQALDTRLSSPGERVTATLSQPIRASNGNVLVPAGAQLRGKVAEISHANGPQLTLDFDSVALAGGEEVPVRVRVLAAEQSHYKSLPAPSGVTSMQGPQAQQPGESQGTPQLSMSKGAALNLALISPIIDAKSLE
jgi:hypothetical protein